MALDLYDPCPCGSGKKFKWCCHPIHVEVDRAFRQEAEGQHDTALRLMDEVIAAHPDNAEALGRKAQLLYENGKAEEAETTLQKAFDLNPKYPFGFFLRGLFRMEEGEVQGSLLSFRKAAEAYDPQAHDYLGRIYTLIVECELKMNRPVAALAALKLALHFHPGNEELRKAKDQVFGPQSRFPAVARKDFSFQPPTSAGRRELWDKALAAPQGKLAEAVQAFEQLTQADGNDAAAWFNLGLSRAWIGENRGALEAFDRYVNLETDEAKAGEAWALAEVLCQGHGMDEFTDFIEHSHLFQMRDVSQVFNLLDAWHQERRFIPFQVSQENQVVSGLVLEKKPQLTPELAANQVLGLQAYILLIGDHLRLWHTNTAALAQARQELQERVGQFIHEVQTEQGPASFNDLLAEVLGFPTQAGEAEKAKQLMSDHTARFFEETWIHRPLKALNGISPVDAAGSPVLRKKLRGVIQFIQECAAVTPAREYDYDRLRRKLGLAGAAGAAGPAATAGPDIAAMSAAELSGLADDKLAEPQLELAYQTAVKLDARELAGRFAKVLIARPVAAGQARDRYPWFSHLVQLALTEGDADGALNYVNEGEKDDCEHNEGRRRNDYELRRGQLHARRGEPDAAADVFERLIQRVPTELRYRGSAAEAMLSARRGDKALHFAEAGLAKAREKNDRDNEQYFLELVDAAKRMK
jgi:tetratricopeptide (TPR) repeat protein